jgi:putative methionine-R-sulfoxide reductase with GAF domain
MSKKSSLDRDSFQQLLASAYAVQESQMDSRFLTAMLGVQRLILRGELGTDSVVSLIADSARDVSGAAGVAIGLLEGDVLVFRAASGCSVPRIGSRVSASLTSSAKTNREILRVEDARTDTRIEGAICRQFGALSLLILPISSDRAVAGVLEIQFSEPHAFQNCEVQMYRLMAALIETAMRRGSEENKRVELSVFPRAVEEVPARGEGSLNKNSLNKNAAMFFSAGRNSIRQRCSAAFAALRGSTAFKEAASLGTVTVQRATEAISHKPLRSLAFAAVAVGLGLTFWIAHGGRRPASSLGASLGTAFPSESATVRSLEAGNPIEGDGTSHAKPSLIAAKLARPARTGPAKTKARRARAGQNSIEYIGNDVTVRHFNYRPAPQRTSSRVSYVGDDVTVRYFTPKSAPSSVSR